MKLLLVCGGQSTEHTVSRMSCVNIYKNCDKSKYDIKVAGITKEGEWYDLVSTDFSSDNWLEGATKINDHFTFLKSFDVVFPVLHGQFGEDGTIQGLLEMAQVPYVGCRVMASCTAMDKIYAKKLFDQANIPQVPSLYTKKDTEVNQCLIIKYHCILCIRSVYNFPILIIFHKKMIIHNLHTTDTM